MYVYEIPSRIYTSNRHFGRWQCKGRRPRISREIIYFENQVLTKLLLISFTRRLCETLGRDGEQAFLRSLAKLGFSARSNKRLLMLYAGNVEDAFTLAASWFTLAHQMQKLLSNDGFLTIYQGVPGNCQEILTISVSPAVDTLDSV